MDKAQYLNIRRNMNFEPRTSKLLQHCTVDASLVAFTALLWWSSESFWVHLASAPLISILMFRGFALMHEAVHGAVSRNKIVNDLAGVVGGCVSFLPYEPWKKVHLEHHYWSGNIDKDPVMLIIKVFPTSSERLKKILHTTWAAWIPLLATLQQVVFWYQSAKQVHKNSHDKALVVSYLSPLLLWGGLCLFMPWQFVLGVLAPAVVFYLVAVEAVNFPHHLELPQNRAEVRLPIWQQHEVTRSCIYPQWFASWAVMNFNYHTEHHMFPEAPWYYLADIHQVLKKDLPELNTDNNFEWIIKNRVRPVSQVLAAHPKQGSVPKVS
ncbi:MAG: fatty acid desaturase [Bdellovibrio sp.]